MQQENLHPQFFRHDIIRWEEENGSANGYFLMTQV
jgi:hypothetical protein